ncbi:hypothetical protein, partial [Pseudomonas sp. NFIX28]|uniref:hypothetical protein n=1 Tax=Pseudomonas sp. NFIX28 TaxID=1566235 RepID=UPI001C44FE1F
MRPALAHRVFFRDLKIRAQIPVAAAVGCEKAAGLPAIPKPCAAFGVDRSLRQRLQEFVSA